MWPGPCTMYNISHSPIVTVKLVMVVIVENETRKETSQMDDEYVLMND